MTAAPTLIEDDARLPKRERLERGQARNLLQTAAANGGSCTTVLPSEKAAAARLVLAGFGGHDGRVFVTEPKP